MLLTPAVTLSRLQLGVFAVPEEIDGRTNHVRRSQTSRREASGSAQDLVSGADQILPSSEIILNAAFKFESSISKYLEAFSLKESKFRFVQHRRRRNVGARLPGCITIVLLTLNLAPPIVGILWRRVNVVLGSVQLSRQRTCARRFLTRHPLLNRPASGSEREGYSPS